MIKVNYERDANFDEAGTKLLASYYSNPGERPQDVLARCAENFSYGDEELAQFIYDASSQHWFFPSSPVLSNAVSGYWENRCEFWGNDEVSKTSRKYMWRGEEPKAMPIACFLTYAPDTIKGQIDASAELSLLSVMGGGAALHNGIRAVSEKAPGPIPYLKSIDGVMGYYRQGRTRRGSVAVYMDVSHPDILEFIKMRLPSGGDSARKIDNRAGFHNAVNISREFKDAVVGGTDWALKCPHTGEVRETVKARDLWETLLETRELTGEPYLWFVDVANAHLPASQKRLGLKNNGSNLCSEISLATSAERTAVCCLSSLNLEKYDEWKDTPLVANLVKFLDNVLQWFIDYSPDELHRARNSAVSERAIGIGAMGFHNWLMKNSIPFEGGGFGSASQQNAIIFKDIHAKGIAESLRLGKERGTPADMDGTGRRNSHVFAIAPNSNSSVLCNTSPSIEPIASNAYSQKSRAGVGLVYNKFLKPVLLKYEMDTPEVWKQIIDSNGSVASLSFLSEHEKSVFKTAWEMDQHWLVQHAEDRQPYICQAQSLNLFFLPGTDRATINSVHLKAMKGEKVKSLYYFRTGSAEAADTVRSIERVKIADWKDDNVCISCEG